MARYFQESLVRPASELYAIAAGLHQLRSKPRGSAGHRVIYDSAKDDFSVSGLGATAPLLELATRKAPRASLFPWPP